MDTRPAADTDLHQLSAHELTQLYRSGAISPVEVTSDLLARIDKLEPAVNAFAARPRWRA